MEQSSPLKDNFGYLTDNKLDVHKLVHSARNLITLSHPVIVVLKTLQKLVRWEFRSTLITILLVSNISCFFLAPLYSTLGIFLIWFVFLILGVSNRKSKVLIKVFPSPLQHESSYNELNHHERMQELRLLLILMDETVGWSSNALMSFYSILKWEDRNFSFKCYTVVFFIILFLFLLPMRIFVVLIIDLVFFYHPIKRCFGRKTRVSESVSEIKSPSSSPQHIHKHAAQSEDTISQSSDLQAEPCTDSEGSEKLPDDSSSCDELQDINMSENLTQPVTENKTGTNIKAAGMVSRLLELKKRRQIEKCTRCEVVFSAILKRRHICSHCGNHFCSRCCSYKVPRSSFGATAPAAQTETVAVCFSCYSILMVATNKKDKAS